MMYHFSKTHLRPRESAHRSGSVLVVILALLSALMLLGFLFFTSASQERENARYFAQSEKYYTASLSADELFDFAMEQVILGPSDDKVNSALWGGRYSLLANLVGRDLSPYSGPGVAIRDAGLLAGAPLPNGVPVVDQNLNDVADSDEFPAMYDQNGDGIDDRLSLHLADWIASTGGSPILPELSTREQNYVGGNGIMPSPDTDYSYPDINSLFLGYIGTEPMTGRQVITPSFHRPQYLRAYSGTNWYTDAATSIFSLRPHVERKAKLFNYNNGTIYSSDLARFSSSAWDMTTTPPAEPSDKKKILAQLPEGVWNNSSPDTTTFEPRLDTDADGDGVNEAIWLDLDFPVEELPDGSGRFIPLFGITILDLDALLNLNAHGNLAASPPLLNANPFVNASPRTPNDLLISRSNEGRQRHEVNPGYGLTASPSEATVAHSSFFGHGPSSAAELANMEFWFILAGRGEVDSTTGTASELILGRWGEADRLKGALASGTPQIFQYPLPGEAGRDDTSTSDQNRGLAEQDFRQSVFPSNIVMPAGRHPQDHQGSGTYVSGGGKDPLLIPLATASGGRIKVLNYVGYWLSQDVGIAPEWATTTFSIFSNLMPGFFLSSLPYGGRYIDDPGETQLDAFYARSQVNDSIFGADETAALHLEQADYDRSGMVSRLLQLVPANFDDSDIRKRFTTVSSDLKAYGNAVGRRWIGDTRGWESGVTESGYQHGLFPPALTGAVNAIREDLSNLNRDIFSFRHEARALLQQQGVLFGARGYEEERNFVKGLVRKLSVNHVAAQMRNAGDGRQRFLLRPLTPHPRADLSPGNKLTADAIPFPPHVTTDGSGDRASGDLTPVFGVPDQRLISANLATWNIGANAAPFSVPGQLQEWHARRDRQNLARDIYTLLYTFGHVDGGFNPMSMDASGHYTDDQLREMAQFAVNVVDAMDPDDTITLFVYDKNLADGYTPYDDGYREPPSYDPGTGHYEDAERGMVFGVEAQQLAFSEVLAIFAKKKSDDSDFTETQWNDSTNHDFLYVELQNMLPQDVTMDGNWSIVCEPTISTHTGLPLTSRSMTIRDASGSNSNTARAGETFTIGSFDTVDGNPDPDAAGGESHSALWVNSSGTMEQIVPGAPDGTLDFDTVTANTADISINLFDPENPGRDGDEATPNDQPLASLPNKFIGSWLDLGDQDAQDAIVADPNNKVTFRLRRRANLHREYTHQNGTTSTDDQDDNPWIEVDSFTVPLRVIDLNAKSITDVVQTDIPSTKRIEPLARHTNYLLSSADPADPNAGRNISADKTNSLGGFHPEDTANPADFWQRHYDRPFASLADLFQVPLYAPADLTKAITEVSSLNPNFRPAVADRTAYSLSRFLFPETDPRKLGPDPGTQISPNGNLWYRALEYLEVPEKYGNGDEWPWFVDYGGPTPWGIVPEQEKLRLRRFGRLNLNTLRHPHALAGLLDDPRVINPSSLLSSNPSLPSIDGSRDWWTSMLISRDGRDPVSGSMVLPGLPSANPFRSASIAPEGPAPGTPPSDARIHNAFNRTLFRAIDDLTPNWMANNDEGRRSLFELGNFSPGNVLGGDVDVATRYRLLGKILNHGTTRSNTYVVFITCDYFEAEEAIDGAGYNIHQIGEKIPVNPANPEEPRFRGVFVVDRTLAMEFLSKKDLPPLDPGAVYPLGSQYRTFSFAREQDASGAGTPTFDWTKLVLSRKTVKTE